MDFVSNFSGRWLEIGIAVYLICMMLYGHYKGFIRLAVSAAALIITLFSVRLAMPHVTDWLKNETPVYEMMRQGMEKAVGLDEKIEAAGGESMEKAAERSVIEALELPEQLKFLLLENNNGEVYRMMGVELFGDYVSGYLADMIIRMAAFIFLFLIVFILLHIVVIWLDLIAKLPILSGLNKIAGAVLGLAEGMIFVWLLCLVFTVLSGTKFGVLALGQINASLWLSWIYKHNMLSYFIIGLVRSVL